MRKVLGLRLAMLFVAASFSGTVLADDESDRSGQGIEGTWLAVVHRPDGTPFIQMLEIFTKDGRVMLLLPWGPDARLPEPPDPPTAGLNDPRTGCVGEWRYAGHRTYDVTTYCLWRQNPGVTPDRIRSKLTLDRSGNILQGPFKYLYSDPVYPPGRAGMEYPFTLECTRLGLVPLE